MRLSASLYMFAAAVLGCATLLPAQSTPVTTPPADPQPCTTAPQPAPCTTSPAKPAGNGSATDRFPFPGETPAPADAPGPAKTVAPTAPSVPDAPAGPSGKRFPFPGEDSSPAAPQPKTSDTGSSSSSSADPTAFPDDDTNTPDPNAPNAAKDKPPEGRRLLKRVNPIGTKLQTNDEREDEDLTVARFYTDQGNLQGAYLRTQDAVKTMPDDPDAHCALAEAALKLNKRDQALSEFNACLKLDPEEKEARNARKQLEKLK